ncbi:MAG: type VI secretion system ATPase TssH [Myxococcota bacterium]
MFLVNYKALFKRLNPTCTRALEAGASLGIARGHYEVTVDHLLLRLLEDNTSDILLVLKNQNVPPSAFVKAVNKSLDKKRNGNTGRPVFSPLLVNWLQDAWLLGSVEGGAAKLRSGHLLAALLLQPERYEASEYQPFFKLLDRNAIREKLDDLTEGSAERGAGQAQAAQEGAAGVGAPTATSVSSPASEGGSFDGSSGVDNALGRFTSDFTELARQGKIDPVLGREREIRQAIDILARRAKNNPIIVGESGVGKTALVEGLALLIAAGDVPEVLKNVELRSLDLGLLQAGAGVKGEFENRLTAVIKEVKSSPKPIILFVDEAHTLIGAGNQAGGGDAANLLKPALARGELRTIAATTWSEYKKYFEKDAALSRRFQLVKVEEPDREAAITMLRGLAEKLRKSHKVHIRDEAVVAAVDLSTRYISGRLLPDKAVDLLDTCAARVKVALTSPPPELETIMQRVEALQRAKQAILEDYRLIGETDGPALQEVEAELKQTEARRETLQNRWQAEKDAAHALLEARGKANPDGSLDAAVMKEALEKLASTRDEHSLVPVEVDPEVVASVVADWTGIPMGKMVRDDLAAINAFDDKMRARIRGQEPAIVSISKRIRNARAGLQDPRQPLGVFLLVGPSGTGKTETAISVADLLFGGERFMTVINMSEFQEKHTVSRLIGSPPGYVGYGEGGVLTEAVRQRPYSVVLLDEVEKADPEIMNLFYQVFDKGQLADGEGRVIDFRNTVIFMTSNLGTDVTMHLFKQGVTDVESLNKALKPSLTKHFKPALLARMTVVPYVPIGQEVLRQIVDLKLAQVAARLEERHGTKLIFSSEVPDAIAARCQEVDSGARNVDHIVRERLLPVLASSVLELMAGEEMPKEMTVKLGDDSNFQIVVPT